MIEILLVVCSVAGGHCETRTLPFDGPLLSCHMAGQFEVATWAQSHPSWRVQRWSCRPREVAI